jgi:hypothetical protein
MNILQLIKLNLVNSKRYNKALGMEAKDPRVLASRHGKKTAERIKRLNKENG